MKWLEGGSGMAGVNTSAWPADRQLPATDGLSAGIGELAASGAERVIWIGALPLTCPSPAFGVTETTCRAAAAPGGPAGPRAPAAAAAGRPCVST